MSPIFVSWVAAGALAGLLAYLVSPRAVPGGLVTDLLIGVTGASLGGYLIAGATGVDLIRGALTWGSLIVSAVAALLMLLLMQTEGSRRRGRKTS